MTEVQAAIGRRQLVKLPEWLSRRRANAAVLAEGLANVRGLTISLPEENIEHAWYKFYARLNLDRLKPGWDQSRIISAINAEGVPCMAGSCAEIYREHAFAELGLVPVSPLPNAADWSSTSLMLLVHPTLTVADMSDAVTAVRKVMAAAT
jgi:dTDP-4-amino-4,6-dideoxygalactose transaminase